MTTIEIDQEQYEQLLNALKYKEILKKAQKKYAESHREKMNEIRRRSYHKKKAEDPTFLERENERHRIARQKKAEKVFLPSVSET